MGHIVEITDLAAPELDVFARLTETQLRSRMEPEKGIFIAESSKVIGRALDAGYTPISLLMDRKHITGPGAEIIARCPDIPVYTADEALLAGLTGYPLTRGCLLYTSIGPAEDPVKERHLHVGLQGDLLLAGQCAVGGVGESAHPGIALLQLHELCGFFTDVCQSGCVGGDTGVQLLARLIQALELAVQTLLLLLQRLAVQSGTVFQKTGELEDGRIGAGECLKALSVCLLRLL